METSSYNFGKISVSKPIPINNLKTNNNNYISYINNNESMPIPIENNESSNEYCLKQNFFDPTKNSPPDNFMEKHEVRMQQYYKSISFKKEESCKIAYFTK